MSLPAAITGSQIENFDIDFDSLAPGTKLLGGQYSILRYLSSGGFGITYLAEDSLKRRVVIKECFPEAICSRRANKSVMARSSAHSCEFRALVNMFVREARNVATLSHRNIVGVHQVFEDNHTAYMALDLIEGRDLLEILEAGEEKLRPDLIVKLLLDLLDAIGTIHNQDMLHRDISPDNILLEETGRAVLIDFGAARDHASKKSRAISALLVVKDGYSPQEFYISGSRQGPSSDLYSLAATFYHLISGEAPMNSQTRLACLARSKPDPFVPISGQVTGYDSAFLKAIDKALNVFPDDRIQSAANWIAMIDPAKRSNSDVTHADKASELRIVISKLIADAIDAPPPVDNQPDGFVPFEPKRIVQAASVDVKKRTSLMDEGDLWPIEIAALQKSTIPDQRTPHLVVDDGRSTSRLRIANSVSIFAITIGILQSPDLNMETISGEKIHKIIAFGNGLVGELDQWITAFL